MTLVLLIVIIDMDHESEFSDLIDYVQVVAIDRIVIRHNMRNNSI